MVVSHVKLEEAGSAKGLGTAGFTALRTLDAHLLLDIEVALLSQAPAGGSVIDAIVGV